MSILSREGLGARVLDEGEGEEGEEGEGRTAGNEDFSAIGDRKAWRSEVIELKCRSLIWLESTGGTNLRQTRPCLYLLRSSDWARAQDMIGTRLRGPFA